jgi:sigma-B regulation protein RsbU (phosphoserine phosphatase)
MYLLIFVDWKSLKSVLTSVGDTHFALQVTGQGFIEAEEEHPQSFLFEKIWASNPSLKESASTLEFKQDDHAGIVSTARVMGYPLTLMSVISSRSAYSVVYQLMTQGSILFIFVLGLIGMGAVFIAKSIASRLELIFRVTNQISQGDFHVQLPTHHKDEIGVLSGQIVKMASDLTNYISEVKEKGRMQAELETANEVQNTLFPPVSWACPQLYLSGKVLPASECGGDWWYYFERAGFLYFFQCDATGHGVPAALITSAARSATSVIERSGETDLKKIVGTLSNAIYDSSNTKLMMTAFVGKINLSTLHLEYVNASHENPVIFSEESDFEYLIQPINPRLGQRENQAYNSGFYQLKKGQKIFIYTDGLFAVTSPNGKTIGERRGLKMVRQIIDQNKTPSDAISGIALWTKDLAEGLPYPDDITISLIQV